MNIGIYIDESYAEFDLENCISEFNQDLLSKPLPFDYQIFFVFANSRALLKSALPIKVYDLYIHPTIDILLVVKQSLYKQLPEHSAQQWLRLTSQSAQLLMGLFSACNLLDDLAIYADFKILKSGSNMQVSNNTAALTRRINRRWQSKLVVQLKQSIPEALLCVLHLFHQLEIAELVSQNNKQLQFDL